jgi:hypothetical protein
VADNRLAFSLVEKSLRSAEAPGSDGKAVLRQLWRRVVGGKRGWTVEFRGNKGGALLVGHA